MILRLLLLAGLFALPSCNLARQALDAEASNEETFDAPPRFNALLREPRPMLQIGLVNAGMQSRMVQESVDGPFVRYLSIDRASIILEHGLLHSLFGFGEGLMGADLSQVLRLVRTGQTGVAVRRHTYLTGADETIVRQFTCTISDQGESSVDTVHGAIATRLMYETCLENGNPVFENQYWVDISTGEVMLSLQWVSEDFGSISTRVIPL